VAVSALCEATQLAVYAISQNEVDALSCLTGRSHSELGRFTVHLLPLS